MNAQPTETKIHTGRGLVTVGLREKPFAGLEVGFKSEYWPRVSTPLTPREALEIAAALTLYATAKQ